MNYVQFCKIMKVMCLYYELTNKIIDIMDEGLFNTNNSKWLNVKGCRGNILINIGC